MEGGEIGWIGMQTKGHADRQSSLRGVFFIKLGSIEFELSVGDAQTKFGRESAHPGAHRSGWFVDQAGCERGSG